MHASPTAHGPRALIVITVAAMAISLQGCTGALLAAQAVPAAIGGTAIANAEDRSPFGINVPAQSAEADLAALEARVLRAECGDPPSQYWLAARLDSGYNATPDRVAIYTWYSLAARGGFEPAKARARAAASALSSEEIESAKQRVADWQPATTGCP